MTARDLMDLACRVEDRRAIWIKARDESDAAIRSYDERKVTPEQLDQVLETERAAWREYAELLGELEVAGKRRRAGLQGDLFGSSTLAMLTRKAGS